MERASKIISWVEDSFIGSALILVTFVLFVNVVLRYFFNANLGWAEEFSRYGIVWITFIGASVCISKGTHIAVDSIPEILGQRWQRVIEISVLLICIVF